MTFMKTIILPTLRHVTSEKILPNGVIGESVHLVVPALQMPEQILDAVEVSIPLSHALFEP